MALHQRDATYAPHNIVPNFLFSIVIARRQKIMKKADVDGADQFRLLRLHTLIKF